MGPKRMAMRFADYLGRTETAIYAILAVLLAVTTVGTLVNVGKMLLSEFTNLSTSNQTLPILNELLIVLMVVEILHTVRISIRSHIMALTEPFLVVGLIASIRRILVLTLEAATLGKGPGAESEIAGNKIETSLVELGLLGVLVLILVGSIILLRRYAPAALESESGSSDGATSS